MSRGSDKEVLEDFLNQRINISKAKNGAKKAGGLDFSRIH